MQLFDKLPVSLSLPSVNNFVLLEILYRYRKNRVHRNLQQFQIDYYVGNKYFFLLAFNHLP